MKTIVRPYKWYKDFIFQFQIFTDKSIQYYMFDNIWKTLDYLLPWKYEVKYICIMKDQEKMQKVAIAKFTKETNGVYAIAGFVPTNMQNRGLGIYAGIAVINHFFRSHPNAIIRSCSYAFNERAFKTTKCMGFKLNIQDERHYESILTKEFFDNDFVNKIKERVGI